MSTAVLDIIRAENPCRVPQITTTYTSDNVVTSLQTGDWQRDALQLVCSDDDHR